MDLLSPIVFAMAVITLVGLVAAGFVIWQEVRTRGDGPRRGVRTTPGLTPQLSPAAASCTEE